VLPLAISHFDRVGLDATHITFALPIMDKYLDYDKNDLNDVMMMASSTDWGRGGGNFDQAKNTRNMHKS